MGSHTPGPWAVDESLCLGAINNGKRHIAMANLYNSPDENFRVDREQQLANAQLIAAAPEMLEALKGALAALERADDYGVPGLGRIIDAADNAIRKAEGE